MIQTTGTFGAETGLEEDVLPGRNSFIFKPDGGPILDQFEAIMRSHQPTRIICIAPNGGDNFASTPTPTMAGNRKIREGYPAD